MDLSVVRRWFNAIRTALVNPQDQTGYGGRFLNRRIAGVRVTHEAAEQVSAVWACMDAIASSMSSSDWNVMRGVRGGDNKEGLFNDTLQYVLNMRFNPEMTAQSGKRAMMLSAVGRGNGIAEIEHDLSGRVIALWPIHPDRFEVRREPDTRRMVYRVFAANGIEYVDLDRDEVVHIRGASMTGYAGDDAIGRAIRTIANAIAIDEFSAAYFENDAQMGVVLETPAIGKMDDKTFERLRDVWQEKSQMHHKFKVGFMDGGMKLHQLQVEAEKAQMILAKQASVEDICRWFRVPPHKVGHLLRATNNNIEHQGLEFSRDTMRPWKVEIEQECDFKLVPWRQQKFIEIDLDWAEEGDYKSRAEAYQILRGCGVFTVNDVLRKLGENTISEDEGGDLRTMNGASVLLQDVGKNMTPPDNAPPDNAPPDNAPPDGEDMAQNWLAATYNTVLSRYQSWMSQNGQRTNAATMARRNAVEYFSARWVDMEASMGHFGVTLSRALYGLHQVIDGHSIDGAVLESFNKEIVT